MFGRLLNIRKKLVEMKKVLPSLKVCVITFLLGVCLPMPVFAASVLGLNNNFSGSPALDVFDPNLSPVASVDLRMSLNAHRLITIDEFFADKNRNGQVDPGEVIDLAVVSGRKACSPSPAINPCGEIVIVDVTSIEVPVVIGNIPMPGIIRKLDIDTKRKWLYAAGDSGASSGGGSAFYIIDISNPFVSGLVDINSDHKDDRIIWTEPYLPSTDGEVTAIRIDTDRQLLYLGTSNGPTPGRLDVYGFTPLDHACLGGKITYTRYKTNPAIGLDYSQNDKMPVRNVVVELKDQYNSVLGTQNTTDEGIYSFSVLIPSSSVPLTITVKAMLGDSLHPDVKVVDNSIPGDLLYEYSFPVTGKRGVCTNKDLNLKAEWSNPTPATSLPVSGHHYVGVREAAPFAILDTIYEVMQFVKNNAQDPALSFQPIPIKVEWSKDNILGAHYLGDDTNIQDNVIYLSGMEDHDTDEYDRNVIAHEWGHYFQKRFSRRDSVGGEHYGWAILDPRVAFSEGWATAFASIALNDPIYVDSKGPQQGNEDGCSVCVILNLEKNSYNTERTFYIFVSGNILYQDIRKDGFYSEASVREVIWDIFDEDNCPACSPAILDDDALRTGMNFKWIYKAMKAQKTTPAFVTIFSFLSSLKAMFPSVTDIADIAELENIGAGDEFGYPFANPITINSHSGAPLYAPGLYLPIPPDGSQMTTGDIEVTKDIDGHKLATYRKFSNETDPKDSRNKLLQFRFFRFKMAVADDIEIEVTPLSNVDAAFLKVYKNGEQIGVGTSPSWGKKAILQLPQALLQSGIDYVIEVGSLREFSADFTFGVKICLDTCN